MTTPPIPPHIRELIDALKECAPFARQGEVEKTCAFIYRSGHIDGQLKQGLEQLKAAEEGRAA